jgi:multiple sugar transport system ATP-binding protein
MTGSDTTTGVRLRGIEKRFDDVAAVRSFDLDIDNGELVVLLGPSGCGKTTVLRMIAGLEEPTSGTIEIGDREVTDLEPADRDVAMVFQNYALYPHMTVEQNLGFGLKMRRLQRSEIDSRVSRAAQVLGLDTLLPRRPGQLSGGQRQRVALGRALVREPRVFLFDEPLSNLDARLRLEMRAEIARLHQQLRTIMIYVTHDQVEAMTLGQRIAVMRDGLLQQYAPPLEVYRSPANLFVARFIGSPPINTVAGEVVDRTSHSVFVAPAIEVPLDGCAFSGRATLGVRPESIAIASDVHDVDFVAQVQRLEPLGNELLVYLECPADCNWVARVDPEYQCSPGEQVGVRLDRTRLHVFAGPEEELLEFSPSEAGA